MLSNFSLKFLDLYASICINYYFLVCEFKTLNKNSTTDCLVHYAEDGILKSLLCLAIKTNIFILLRQYCVSNIELYIDSSTTCTNFAIH